MGTRIAATILDCWHELDAEGDLAATGQAQGRRPWNETELAEAVAAVRRMGEQEARLGRSLSPDEAGDAVCELAAWLGRRWSETRRIVCAVNDLADEAKDGAAADAEKLTAEETKMLRRLLRGDGRG